MNIPLRIENFRVCCVVFGRRADDVNGPCRTRGLRRHPAGSCARRVIAAFAQTACGLRIRDGRVLKVDGAVCEPKLPAARRQGHHRHAARDAQAAARPCPEAIPPDVVFEDDALIVIDKPAGLVSTRRRQLGRTLLNVIAAPLPASRRHSRAPASCTGWTKDTSGLAGGREDAGSADRSGAQLQARTVKREHQTLARGVVERAGTVDACRSVGIPRSARGWRW